MKARCWRNSTLWIELHVGEASGVDVRAAPWQVTALFWQGGRGPSLASLLTRLKCATRTPYASSQLPRSESSTHISKNCPCQCSSSPDRSAPARPRF